MSTISDPVPTNGLGKAGEDGLSFYGPAIHVKDLDESPGPSMARLQPLRPFGD